MDIGPTGRPRNSRVRGTQKTPLSPHITTRCRRCKHTEAPYPAPPRDTQRHSDGDTAPRTILITCKKRQNRAHLFKQITIDPQLHTHGKNHKTSHNTRLPQILYITTEDKHDRGGDIIIDTHSTSPTPTLPVLHTTYRAPHTRTPAHHSI